MMRNSSTSFARPIRALRVHVIAESPLLVAATGQQGWGKGELLGVFAHRGEQIVNISMVPNDNFPTGVRIDSETADSITFALGDPDLREHTRIPDFRPEDLFPEADGAFRPGAGSPHRDGRRRPHALRQ